MAMADLDPVQAVGVLAFASVVLYLVRELKPVLRDILREQFETRILIAAMLERDRIRDARRKRETSQPPMRSGHLQLAPPPKGEFDREESTDIHHLIKLQREAAKKPRGERPPRRGTHHDGEDQ